MHDPTVYASPWHRTIANSIYLLRMPVLASNGLPAAVSAS